MKKLFYFAAFAACVLTSCQQVLDIQEKEEDIKTPEENESQGKKETPGLVFTATTEGSATKTALEEDSGNYNVAWRSGDEITIVDAAATPNVGVYSTSSNTTSADFTFALKGAEASTAPFKAWYPASIYNNGAPTLPATQEYVEGNIAGSPMFASSSTTSLKFKNLAGIICLNLSTGMADISVASIVLSATQPMSGPISNAESLSSETPVAATVSGSAGVTLNCGAGVAINGTPKPFYFAVPAGTYSGLSITVTATTGAYQTFTLKADKTIVVERSKITDINLTANNWTLTPKTIVDLASISSEYTAQDGEILTGTLGSIVQIKVAAGASIVLKDATINGVGHDTYYTWSGLNCLGDATITLVGTNTVRGFNNKFPGINVPFGNDLIIRGTGSLHASTSGWGAGIGGRQNISCGNIRIEGGDITAVGGEHSAGIGGGWTGSAGKCGNIVITGGTIHATGYDGAAGIGAGSNSRCGDITISGGDITAIGGSYAAGIGSSAGNSPTIGACGNISITGGTIHATGGDASAGIGGGYYCGTIDITDGVTEIIATKGAGAPNSIGAGKDAICGTVTITPGANVTQN